METPTKNIIVVFGATGDLARRYLLPAICALQDFHDIHVVLVGRRDWERGDVEDFLEGVRKEFDTRDFDTSLYDYLKIDLMESANYQALADYLNGKDLSFTNVIYYLSLGPNFFVPVVKNLAYHGLHQSQRGGDRRIVIEKPFGKDLKTATHLNLAIQDVFSESHVYRIDHYLGKNAVVDLMNYRLEQGSDWGKYRIKKISVIADEIITVLSRGEYYDTNGAIRDYVQNHLLQMLAIAAMREPYTMDSDDIRDRKMQLLQSISPLLVDPRHGILLGQYEGYKQEEGVDPNSRTETFIRVELHSDDPFWKGVPFLLQTGKALDKKETKVVIDMVDGTQKVFAETSENKNNAYETLIDAVIRGDQTLFVRWDSIKAAWQIVNELLNCKDDCPLVYTYPQGSQGPMGAQKLNPSESKLKRSNAQKLKEQKKIKDYEDLTDTFFLSLDAIRAKSVHVGLSGGSSLDGWYEYFLGRLDDEVFCAEAKKYLTRVRWCLVDERIVDLGHKDSNYKKVMDSFLSHLIEKGVIQKESVLPIEPQHLFPAGEYSTTIPRVDIGFFGVGPDGHIASLFPRSKENEYHLDGEDKEFIIVEKNSKDAHKRLTMSPAMVRDVDTAFVFFVGETKEQVYKDFINAEVSIDQCPAKLLYDAHRLCIFHKS